MKPFRIRLLLVTPWVSRHGGGVAEAVRLLAAQMSQNAELAVEVVSVTERDGAMPLEGWGSARITTYPYHGPGNYRFSLGLLRHLLRSDADIVHVHGIWTFQCLAVLLWSLVKGRPYVVSPHGMLEGWILSRSRTLKRLVSSLYQTVFLRRAADFHVLTEKECQDVARFAPKVHRTVVPNFVEQASAAVGRPGWWRTEFAERTVFLFLGRIHVKKGWQELCAAWEQLCTADCDFAQSSQLVFCGWVDDSPTFEATVVRLESRFGNITFAGPQYGQERAASLAAADGLVLPSHSEGLPMVVLEAWAAGRPVLMTKECNLPIGFIHGAALEISLVGDDIVRGLRSFAMLPAVERERIATAGRSLVEQEFSPAASETRILDIYRRALAVASVEQPRARGTVPDDPR